MEVVFFVMSSNWLVSCTVTDSGAIEGMYYTKVGKIPTDATYYVERLEEICAINPAIYWELVRVASSNAVYRKE